MKDLIRPAPWIAVALALAACTSVSSRKPEPAQPDRNNGLVYSLPNRMIDVQVVFSKEGEHTITVKGGGYYPDGDEDARFVARIHKGKVGSIKATLVSSNGLLDSADAKYTGKMTELATALGSAMGVASSASIRTDLPKDDPAHCKREMTVNHSRPLPAFDGTFAVSTFNAMGGTAACANVTLTVERLGTFTATNATAGTPKSGLWYRMELPYTVHATLGDGITATAIIMLPDESPPYFVGMDAGIFADTENKLKFSNGMLTSYEKSNDSEVISLFKLPAEIISAYAKAVGDVFSNFSTAERHEVNAEVDKINRELLLQKIESCNLAISQKQPADTIQQLCGLEPLP